MICFFQADCRERNVHACQTVRDALDGVAGFALIGIEQGMVQHGAAESFVLGNLAEKRQIHDFGHCAGGHHFTGMNEIGIQTVDDEPGTGKIL